MFRSLFQVDGQTQGAVSPSVRELWGHGSSPGAGASSGAQANGNAPRPLDLFSDPTGAFSG
jgi:hypothetical protein